MIHRPKQLFSSKDELLHQQLIMACMNGNEDMFNSSLEEIMQLYPNDFPNIINRQNYIGETALILCIVHGNITFAQKLLALHAIDVKSCTFLEQKNFLMFASERGYSGLVVSFTLSGHLMSKLNINAQDSNGRTALMYACENGYFSSVQGLLKGKPDVNLVDTDGRTALHYVFKKSFSAVVGSKRQRSARDSFRHQQQSSTVVMITQSLLNAGARIQIKDKFGKVASDYVHDSEIKDLFNNVD